MRRELSYQFDLDIQRVHLIINMKCEVQVWWKSGKGKIATQNSIKLMGTQKYFDIRQKLSIIAKIVMQNGILRQKKTQLLIILFTSENTSKLGGRVNLNLAEFISPDALTAPITRRFQKSLENCPDQNSKIVFNLNCKYIEENFGGRASQNLNDISFQANNFSSSFGGSSNFARSTSDMTFRPEKQQFGIRKQQSNPGYQPAQSNRSEYTSKQKKRMEYDRQQKVDTPNWDRSQKQKQQQFPSSSSLSVRNKQRQYQKPYQQPQPSQVPQSQQRPMQFSFNPLTAADRQKMGLDNNELIKDLKQIVQERGRTIKSLQQQLSRIRNEFQQKNEKSSSKSLSLLNELNSTTAQKEQLQRQKMQLYNQIEALKKQNKKMQQQCKSINFQFSESNNELMARLEQRKKMIEQLNMKLEQADRKNIKLKDQLFRKENQIITKQKQFMSSQVSKQTINREQTEKLKSISIALKDLQANFEKVFSEKQQLKRKYEESVFRMEKIQQSKQLITQNVFKLEQQAQKQREKARIIQNKYKQRQSLIHEIQSQFKHFSAEKSHQLKQKDEQLSILRDKFNSACKKIDEVAGGQESMKNLVSQKNIRIKTLQNICGQLQRTIQQKQQLILKAKQYVKNKQQYAKCKEQQIELKNAQINKRDEFIQKCKVYMQNKEKEYNQAISGVKNNSSQTHLVRKQLREKQMMLQKYINDRHKSEKQIQDMENAIDRLKQKLLEYEENIDQLQRKNQSQQGTLKDLVKKNLDMEIQLNIKDYQIQALRNR